MDKVNIALEEAKKFINDTSKELSALGNQNVKQNVTHLVAISTEFANKFTDLKGSDKKIVATFVANALVSQFTNVKIDETLSDTIDVVVDLSRGKFNLGKMKEVADDVKDAVEDTKEAMDNMRCSWLCL
jgi:hypothetical protein